MTKENRLFDDLARVAGGALGALSGVKEEVELLVRGRVERLLADMDLVPRDEFEAVKAIAAAAQAEAEALAARVAALESKGARAKPAGTAAPGGPSAPVTRRRPAHRPAGAAVKKAGPRKAAAGTEADASGAENPASETPVEPSDT